MSCSTEFQRRGAEQLKAQDPMVVMREIVRASWVEEEDLRQRVGSLA